jgi:transposase
MNERPCKRSDLKVFLDLTPRIGVSDDGTPRQEDLVEVAARLTADWRDNDFEWYYVCGNCSENSGFFEDMHCEVGKVTAQQAFSKLHPHYAASPGTEPDTGPYGAASDVVTESAPTDLTDAEWALLVPVLQPTSNRYARDKDYLSTSRRALDGIIYRSANGGAWSDVPRRYGKLANIYQRYLAYRARGNFKQMLAAVQDKPDAGRIVAWLRALSSD